RAAAPDPARHPDRTASSAGRRPPPHPVPGVAQAHRAADRRPADVPELRASLTGADVLRRGGPVPARRTGSDQSDLAVGTVRALAGDKRRPTGLVLGVADRSASADAELRSDDRPLHAGTEP